MESPALKKTTSDTRIEVSAKLRELYRREILGLRRVSTVRLKFLLESSGSTISFTVLTVINVKGLIAGPITKAGTFNGREKHLTGLTK